MTSQNFIHYVVGNDGRKFYTHDPRSRDSVAALWNARGFQCAVYTIRITYD